MQNNKKMIGTRVDPNTIILRDELVKYFNDHQLIGTVTNGDIVELAIKELHENYLKGGDS